MAVADESKRSEPLKLRFSKGVVEAIPFPAKGRVYYHDLLTPGLCVSVTAAGGKVFYHYRRVDGRPVRYRIGSFTDCTVENARKAVAKLNGQIAEGKNPQQAKQERRAEMTVGELFDYHLEHYAKPHKKTWKQDEWMFRRFLAGWRERKLSSIKTSDVQSLHTRIGSESGKFQANRLVELLAKLFVTAAEKHDWTKGNPALKVDRFPEKQRARFLQPDELPKFFQAVDDHSDPDIRHFVYMALFTGARRGNVQAMRWADVDLARQTWRVPETKNGEAITIELVAPAVEILQTRREASNGSEWVFASRRKGATGHLVEPKRAWKQICAAAGIADLRIHDLRRSMGSWQALTGASLLIIGKTLGHKTAAATMVYARLNQDPVRQAMEKATAAMLSLKLAADG